MKKVKLMLTTVVVLTFVGGSLAFKAKKEHLPARCYFSTAKFAGQCNFVGIVHVTLTPDPTGPIKAITTSTTTTQIGIPTCTNVVGGGNPNPLNCVTVITEIE
jgi:hypothetical protein